LKLARVAATRHAFTFYVADPVSSIHAHGSQKLRVDPPSREATARQVVESVEAPLELRTFTELREADLLGRMNVHGALNHSVQRVGVHHVEDRMNYLIALDPQKRRSKDLFRKAKYGGI
jgi:hypothetical protein